MLFRFFCFFFHIPMDKDCKQGGKKERGCVDVTSQSGFSFQRELQQGLQGGETSSGDRLTAKRKSREKCACRGGVKKSERRW